MKGAVLFAVILAGCGGFDLDARISGTPGETLIVVDGAERPYLEWSWSFPSFTDALQAPPSVSLTGPDGDDHEVTISVFPCAEDETDWESAFLAYQIRYEVDAAGEHVLRAALREASCTKGDRGLTIIVD